MSLWPAVGKQSGGFQITGCSLLKDVKSPDGSWLQFVSFHLWLPSLLFLRMNHLHSFFL